jgi:hypothetical protein
LRTDPASLSPRLRPTSLHAAETAPASVQEALRRIRWAFFGVSGACSRNETAFGPRHTLCLLGHFVQRKTQCIGYPLSVGGIGLQAVADVACLDLVRGISHCTAGVGKQHGLLLGSHQAEDQARRREDIAESPEQGTGNREQREAAYAPRLRRYCAGVCTRTPAILRPKSASK